MVHAIIVWGSPVRHMVTGKGRTMTKLFLIFTLSIQKRPRLLLVPVPVVDSFTISFQKLYVPCQMEQLCTIVSLSICALFVMIGSGGGSSINHFFLNLKTGTFHKSSQIHASDPSTIAIDHTADRSPCFLSKLSDQVLFLWLNPINGVYVIKRYFILLIYEIPILPSFFSNSD